MKFELDEDELKLFKAWNARHLAESHDGKVPYGGAIGGRISFIITDTSLGRILNVKCSCGAQEGLTNFDDW